MTVTMTWHLLNNVEDCFIALQSPDASNVITPDSLQEWLKFLVTGEASDKFHSSINCLDKEATGIKTNKHFVIILWKHASASESSIHTQDTSPLQGYLVGLILDSTGDRQHPIGSIQNIFCPPREIFLNSKKQKKFNFHLMECCYQWLKRICSGLI